MTLRLPLVAAGRRASAALLVALAACSTPEAPPVAPTPKAPPPAPVASAESQAMAAHYLQVQTSFLDSGLLRTDGGGPDTPFTDAMLARAFLSIAFQAEFAGGDLSHGRESIPLERWEDPIRMALDLGPSIPADQAATLRATVASYLARLSRLTGLPIALNDANPNFFVHIGSVEERAALGPALAAEMPGLTAVQTDQVLHLSPDAYCQVLTQNDGITAVTRRALAVIPSEHPPLMFQACLHEEIAQALGLPNDSNLARPSIFNDDQEFALLTRMDELMLKILYSPELRPGMTADQARPIVETLATRLMDGQT